MRLSRAPPLRNLRAFCIAARHRSFKAAADELALTPSAVSHQMKELEEVMGVRLFERKTRSLAMTTAGHTLLDEMAPLLDMIDRSLAQFSRRKIRLEYAEAVDGTGQCWNLFRHSAPLRMGRMPSREGNHLTA